MQRSKALKFAIGVGSTAVALLMLSTFAPRAEATPDIAKGKPCTTCHTSSKPSKADVKKDDAKKDDAKKDDSKKADSKK